MLELRPTCEQCNKPLPPAAIDAMICSYECTFCRDCVEEVLQNVCPNCGGGFERRPIRPSKQLKRRVSTAHQVPSTTVVFKPVDLEDHQDFAKDITEIPPELR